MITKEIVCPSGMRGVIRKIKVSDLEVFTDRKLRSEAGGMLIDAELARRVWMETLDRGPYAFDGPPPFKSDVLQGDRFFVVLQSRILTRGGKIEMQAQCENDACKHAFVWELNLNDLPVATLEEGSAQLFADGNVFETQLEQSGDLIAWALPNGTTQRRADKMIRQYGKSLSVIYAARVRGVKRADGTDVSNLVEYIADLDLEDFDQLVYEMESADCGVETTIEMECPRCESRQEEELGFGRDFFTRDFSRARSSRATETMRQKTT